MNWYKKSEIDKNIEKEPIPTAFQYTRVNPTPFNPSPYGLSSDVTEIVGRGVESLVVSNEDPDSPVYKIPTYNPETYYNGVKLDPYVDVLLRRQETVEAIKKLEQMGEIQYLRQIMRYATYLDEDKPELPEGAFYDKDTKSFVVEETLPIRNTHIEIQNNGIITQDKMVGSELDKETWLYLKKAIKKMGIFVDPFGANRNFSLDEDGKLIIYDGVS